ncbi:hypothetical protein ACFWOJ_36830 [Streptomyces sp. NPDC058439]|uniref:hypothetical protein n=1 Tax=Streptomyces sp. NPDC058439 TaxID=3346500 RepID=UPI0036667A4D
MGQIEPGQYTSGAFADACRLADVRQSMSAVGSSADKGSRGGRPVTHDTDLYRDRNTVERAINKPKTWRGIGEVDSGRSAGVSTSGFPRSASRVK